MTDVGAGEKSLFYQCEFVFSSAYFYLFQYLPFQIKWALCLDCLHVAGDAGFVLGNFVVNKLYIAAITCLHHPPASALQQHLA